MSALRPLRFADANQIGCGISRKLEVNGTERSKYQYLTRIHRNSKVIIRKYKGTSNEYVKQES